MSNDQTLYGLVWCMVYMQNKNVAKRCLAL